MRENWKRILVGLLVILVVGRLGRYLPPTFDPSDIASIEKMELLIAIKGYVLAFAGTIIGGFIARKKFLVPAVAYMAVSATYVVVRMTQRSYSRMRDRIPELDIPHAGSEQILGTIWASLPSLAVLLAIAAAGSLVGMRLAKFQETRQSRALN